MITKKRQRCDFSISKRSEAENPERKPLIEKEKAAGQYKRSRSDNKANGNCGPTSNQHILEEKSGNFRFEESIRRLRKTGDDWDSKNKTKRSVGGVVGNRSDELKIKRTSHPNFSAEPSLKARDASPLRKQRASSWISRADSSLESTISCTNRSMIRNFSEGSSLIDQKIGENEGIKSRYLKKPIEADVGITAKNSRVTRTGSIKLLDSSPKSSLSNSSLKGSNDFSAANDVNKKRNSAMAQWVGQRPHQNSRTRRSFSTENKESPAGSRVCKSKNGLDSTETSFRVFESDEPCAKMKIKDDCEKLGSRGAAVRKVAARNEVVKRRIPKATTGRPSDVLPNKCEIGRVKSTTSKDRKTSLVSATFNSEPLSSSAAGESDEDREELVSAIKAAQAFKGRLCSSPFWNHVEPSFTCIRSQDIAFLKQQQLGFDGEIDGCPSETLTAGYSAELNIDNQRAVKCGQLRMRASLYQRVLSAIIDDQSEEHFPESDANNASMQCVSDDSHSSCTFLDSDNVKFESDPTVSFRLPNRFVLDVISSDKSVSSKESTISSSLCSNGYWVGESYSSHDVWHSSENCFNDVAQPRDASSDDQYHLLTLDDKLLLELQSIGLSPEPLPDLSEPDVIDKEIIELRARLSQKVGSKKKRLEKLCSALVPAINDKQRDIEQVALDQLIESAYKKNLACLGKTSSKSSTRMEKKIASGFLKRALLRCRKYEESGVSCFMASDFKDLLASYHIENGSDSTPCARYKRNDALTDGAIGSTSSRVASQKNEERGNKLTKINDVERESSNFDNLCNIIKEDDDTIGLHHDVDFFSNIDDDDEFNTMGLEIPMDDLSDLQFVL